MSPPLPSIAFHSGSLEQREMILPNSPISSQQLKSRQSTQAAIAIRAPAIAGHERFDRPVVATKRINPMNVNMVWVNTLRVIFTTTLVAEADIREPCNTAKRT